MQNHKPYLSARISMYCTQLKGCKLALLLVLMFMLQPGQAKCQSDDSFDEISLILNVPRVGSVEIPSVIYRQEAYLPAREIFSFLKIKNKLSDNLDVLSGYIVRPENSFIIDKSLNQITYQGLNYKLLPEDLIQTESNLFLKSSFFGDIFGLVCTFNFRSLSVTLTTKIELPILIEMQQELVRKNIAKLRGEKIADTTIGRDFNVFKLGVADWAITSSQNTGAATSTIFSLNLGAALLGGQADVLLNQQVGKPFDKKRLIYNWRYVNNKNPYIRQVNIGSISPQSAITILSPMNGIQISNSPTSSRRSYGTYTLSNKTEPGWLVELYINNVLVNFIRADASGFYSFEIPMVYGSSEVKLRFYGPWGEERTSEQYINIPFNFIPLHQFEYSISGGIANNEEKNRFASAKLGYGLSRHFTIGGGVEYLSGANYDKPMPYLNASARLGRRILISGERMNAVKSGAVISYRSPSRLQLNFTYTKYDPGQTAIVTNYREVKKLEISKPFRGKKFSAFSRFTYSEYTMPKSKFTNAELLTSVTKGRVNANFSTNAIFSGNRPFLNSKISMGLNLKGSIKFTPQVQYDYSNHNFNLLRVEFEKKVLKKGFLNISYQVNPISKTQIAGIGFRYNFSFAQTAFNTFVGNHKVTSMQSVRGSMIYDNNSNYFGLNDQSNIGRGGIVVAPFLDLNCDGIWNENEPKVSGLNLRINGGRIEKSKKDSTIRIMGLEATNSYFIEIDQNSFDNVAWRLPNKTISVDINPNSFKKIEIPVAVVGEVTGTVSLNQNNSENGIGRIIVYIKNANTGKNVAKLLTEADGYFSFLGLAPGKYIVAADMEQLQKLGMTVIENNKPFSIKPKREGDIADGIDLLLTK